MSEQVFAASFTQLLESFSCNFSLDKVKNNEKFEEIVFLVKELEKVKFLLPSYEFLNTLKAKIYCGYCLESFIDIQTKCGHGFCNSCMEIIISQGLTHKSRVSCALCTSEIILSGPYPNFTECKQCGHFLHESLFYKFPLCHSTCKICINKKMSLGNGTCTSCYKALKFDYDSIYKCCLCHKDLHLATSNFLCRSHAYCFACFKAGLSEGRCFSCDLEIDPKLHIQLMSFLSSTCSMCNKTKEKSLFINKSCCIKRVCVTCQVDAATHRKFGEKCMSCQKKLNLLSGLEI